LLSLELCLVQCHVMLAHVLLQARVVPVGFSAAIHHALILNDISLCIISLKMTYLLMVQGLVLLQVGSGGKGSAANVADKRAHPSMQPHMSDEVANLFKYLS
jgi:hypothetical protein